MKVNNILFLSHFFLHLNILLQILIFEGEYFNGERNGKGKEYKYSDLVFESQYLNGRRNGEGKEYDYLSGKLIFEGEYLNGNKWNGNGYKNNNNIAYSLKDGKGLIKDFRKDIIFFNYFLFSI